MPLLFPMTKHRRTVAPATYTALFNQSPSNGAQPLGQSTVVGPYSFPGNSIRPSICDPFSGNKRCHSASRGSVKRRVLGERMEEERTGTGGQDTQGQVAG